MALIKQEVTAPVLATTGAIIEQAVEDNGVNQDSTLITDPAVLAALEAARTPVIVEEFVVIQESQALAPAANNLPSTSIAPSGPLANLADRGFEGLAFDWTSFPSISLKIEGNFEDFDGQKYGTEFECRLRGSKERWVYRANPVLDNKRDVAFSYDRVATQNGILLEDKKREWIAQGKTIEEKLYIEVMVEMVAPGEVYDGEYRILSISPTSKGRFTGHAAKCAAMGGGDPGEVISKILVGAKITKVANPFYPWAFEVVKD